jgi:nitronate monooxygenase
VRGSREAREEYERARAGADFDVAVIYAGEGIGMVTGERPAAEIVRQIGEGAEEILRRATTSLLSS